MLKKLGIYFCFVDFKRTKFYDLDSKPVCKHCFDKLPSKVRTNILKSSTKEKESTNKSSLFSWIKDK
jgi:hypothetical protein